MWYRWIASWTASLAAAVVGLSDHARAQCPDWQPGFGLGGTSGAAYSMTVFDDGGGAALYVGGTFGQAGAFPVGNVASWNGSSWSPVGSGTNGWVSSLRVFDDGGGPALYAAGSFTSAGGAPASRAAKWDGSSWSALGAGTNSDIFTLAVFDDGSGPALYAGGQFSTAGGVPAQRIAKWDGAVWTPLGSGVGGVSTYVTALAVFDDGSGPALFVGGHFTSAGGVSANSIAKWDGVTWSPLASGITGSIESVAELAVFDDGGGADLYAGGAFTMAGGGLASRIARWDGSSWSALGSGVNSDVLGLKVFDDGSGPALFASGDFTTAGGSPANRAAKWNGAAWSALGSGMDAQTTVLEVFDAGSGSRLFAGGLFESAGGVAADHVAEWDGSSWSNLGGGNGVNALVRGLAVASTSSGTALYACGDFDRVGGLLARGVASWNGSSWSVVGSGMPSAIVNVLAPGDDGSGPALFVGGVFGSAGGVAANHVAKWDGIFWSALGAGVGGTPFAEVDALSAFDDGSGSALYVGGFFHTAGGVPAESIAKWNGTTWSALGSGLNDAVYALAVFNDGSGPALYAGGDFTSAGGSAANRIARWDGTSWSPLGSGLNGPVYALSVYNDGGGPKLFAGGGFTMAGGVAASRVARWNGTSWSALGSGTDDAVIALAVFDDGGGPALFAGGHFTTAGGASANYVARWRSSTWSAMDAGMAGGVFGPTAVSSLASFDGGHGGGPDLYIGGEFETAGPIAAVNVALWHGCPGPGTPFCPGDGSTIPCPCGNSGAQQHGCQNSVTTGGAQIFASGTTSPDTVVLHASGELTSALTIFLQGNATSAPGVTFGDGLRCAGGTLKRLYVKGASAGAVTAPAGADPSITVRSAALGDPIAAGERRYYQTYYRDSNAGWCLAPPATFNASNGVKIVW